MTCSNFTTYPTGLDFTQLDAYEFQDFAWSVLKEFDKQNKRILSKEGLRYSHQNPENFLCHLRLFCDPALMESFSLVCNKLFLETSDKDLVDFLTQLFETVKFSPLLPRVFNSMYIDPFEHATFHCSVIFNTAAQHNGDPRTFF